MIYEVLQTEKAYRTQEKNTYIITFKGNVTPSKITVIQELKKNGLNPISVNKVVPPRKTRSRNGRRTNITVRRPVKYYVTLKQGETLIQETAQETETSSN